MYTAVSGQLAIFKQIEVIANNLANMNTTGFKSEKLLFEKAMAEQVPLLGASFKSDVQSGDAIATEDFVKIRGSTADLGQGPLELTGNPLDAAIEGKGFFVVQTPEGERYTRAGNFRLDTQKRLVTQSGYPVQGSGGDITINGKAVDIAEDGSISVDRANIGKLRVVEFEANQVLREPSQLFKLKEGGSLSEVNSPLIKGGAVEASNVNAVRELTDMMIASRIYEGFQKVQESGGKMTQARNQYLGTQG